MGTHITVNKKKNLKKIHISFLRIKIIQKKKQASSALVCLFGLSFVSVCCVVVSLCIANSATALCWECLSATCGARHLTARWLSKHALVELGTNQLARRAAVASAPIRGTQYLDSLPSLPGAPPPSELSSRDKHAIMLPIRSILAYC